MAYRDNVVQLRSDVAMHELEASSEGSSSTGHYTQRDFCIYKGQLPISSQSGIKFVPYQEFDLAPSSHPDQTDAGNFFFVGRPSYPMATLATLDSLALTAEASVFPRAGAATVKSSLQKKVDALEMASANAARAIGRLESKLDALVSALSTAGLGIDTDESSTQVVDLAALPQLTGQALALALNALADDETPLDTATADFVRSLLGSADGAVRASAARALAYGTSGTAVEAIGEALAKEQNRAVAAVMRGALRATT